MSVKGFNTTGGIEKYDYNSLDNLPEDTGWVDCTMVAVNAYGGTSNNRPMVRKVGSIVYLRGIVSPTNAPVTDMDPAFTIPAGFRPSGVSRISVQQGSGSNRFCLEIKTNGNARIYRYSNNTNTNNDIPADAWLNCNSSWLVG